MIDEREEGEKAMVSGSETGFIQALVVDSFNIDITVSNDGPSGLSRGNFRYSHALLRVKLNDTITWTFNGGSSNFALEFKEGSPIGQILVNGATGGGPFTVSVPKGNFHYSVAVWDGTNVHIDSGCPRISVN
jgi:hypothetical protein